MEKKELAQRLAEEARIPAGDAADELDDVLDQVIRSLRNRDRTRPNALQRLIDDANCGPAKERKAKR